MPLVVSLLLEVEPRLQQPDFGIFRCDGSGGGSVCCRLIPGLGIEKQGAQLELRLKVIRFGIHRDQQVADHLAQIAFLFVDLRHQIAGIGALGGDLGGILGLQQGSLQVAGFVVLARFSDEFSRAFFGRGAAGN